MLKKTLVEVDIERAKNGFKKFLELHDLEIKRLRKSSKKTLKSMGI